MKLLRRQFLPVEGAAGRVADRNGANLRPARLMVGYAAGTDRYRCTER
jgi:hypothetical protein